MMSTKNWEMIKNLIDLVALNDFSSIQKFLEENSILYNKTGANLFHLICKGTGCVSEGDVIGSHIFSTKNFDLIYVLLEAGFDIEQKDEDGNTCLFYAVQSGNSDLCNVLLQCGADMWAETELGISIYDYVSQLEAFRELQDIFNKFYPGLWKAVECENIYQVRKLVNLWCRTKLCKNGITLKDAALQTENEEIINLILGILESMEMVYHIFAKNTKAVKGMLETCKKKLRLDLRKMSDRGAPILYYLIQSKNVPAIELFISHGCQVYTIMQDDFGCDMPVIFSALKPDMPADVIKALLPKTKTQLEEMLCKILYKGKTVLEVALEENVSLEIVNLLIDRGGPLLLSERNQFNQTVRDLAVLRNQQMYSIAIDQIVNAWIANPWKYPGKREHLILYGWQFVEVQLEGCEEEYIDAKEFKNDLKYFQTIINHLSEEVEEGNIEEFTELSNAAVKLDLHEKNVLWHGKVVGDGMPLLHKAVLHNRPKIVEMILCAKPPRESIDNLFDQNHRTALHYAYASSTSTHVRKLLLNYGCSEHVLDKLNKEPLDFWDKQDDPAMSQLISRLKLKAFTQMEPDPWNFTEENSLAYSSKQKKCNPAKSIHCNTHSDVEISSEDESESQQLCLIT